MVVKSETLSRTGREHSTHYLHGAWESEIRCHCLGMQAFGQVVYLNSRLLASSSPRGIGVPGVLTSQGFSRMMLVTVTAGKNHGTITAYQAGC